MKHRDESLVSESNVVERELAALRERATELEREVERCQRLATLGTLAASVAHEFNNLLTPIVSYAQLAMHSPDDGELVEKALRKAIEGSEKASGIASSMLGFIRDDEEGFVHVAAAMNDALGCLAREPSKDGIHLEMDIGPECWVRMRPVALEQVLLNLFLNARAAMKPSGGMLRVSARCSTWNVADPLPPHCDPAGEIIEIRVEDSGPGIPADLVDRIFQPFVRDRRKGGTSTGLGLSICQRLVQGVGGTIMVENRQGVGATFVIRLPRECPAGAAMPEDAAPSESRAA